MLAGLLFVYPFRGPRSSTAFSAASVQRIRIQCTLGLLADTIWSSAVLLAQTGAGHIVEHSAVCDSNPIKGLYRYQRYSNTRSCVFAIKVRITIGSELIYEH